jgi:hypothetical protein
MYNFKLGESKIVGVKVYSNDGAPFLINSATYQLIKCDTKIIESSGNATVDCNKVTTLITPLSTGNYILKLTFEIVPEKLIEEIQINVD